MSELWRKAKARDMKHVSTMWPVGQVVKTAASHAVNIGSNPVWVTNFICAFSSVGRAADS